MINIAKITNDKLKEIRIANKKKFLLDRRDKDKINEKTNIVAEYIVAEALVADCNKFWEKNNDR